MKLTASSVGLVFGVGFFTMGCSVLSDSHTSQSAETGTSTTHEYCYPRDRHGETMVYPITIGEYSQIKLRLELGTAVNDGDGFYLGLYRKADHPQLGQTLYTLVDWFDERRTAAPEGPTQIVWRGTADPFSPKDEGVLYSPGEYMLAFYVKRYTQGADDLGAPTWVETTTRASLDLAIATSEGAGCIPLKITETRTPIATPQNVTFTDQLTLVRHIPAAPVHGRSGCSLPLSTPAERKAYFSQLTYVQESLSFSSDVPLVLVPAGTNRYGDDTTVALSSQTSLFSGMNPFGNLNAHIQLPEWTKTLLVPAGETVAWLRYATSLPVHIVYNVTAVSDMLTDSAVLNTATGDDTTLSELETTPTDTNRVLVFQVQHNQGTATWVKICSGQMLRGWGGDYANFARVLGPWGGAIGLLPLSSFPDDKFFWPEGCLGNEIPQELPSGIYYLTVHPELLFDRRIRGVPLTIPTYKVTVHPVVADTPEDGARDDADGDLVADPFDS